MTDTRAPVADDGLTETARRPEQEGAEMLQTRVDNGIPTLEEMKERCRMPAPFFPGLANGCVTREAAAPLSASLPGSCALEAEGSTLMGPRP
jgi:hypothetical protein